MRTILRTIAAFFVLASGASSALRLPLSPECLVRQSALIVSGTVNSISRDPITRDGLGDIYAVKFSYEKVLSGDVSSDEFVYLTVRSPEVTDQAVLKERHAYYLFISDSEAGRYVTNGPQGVKEILKDGVKSVFSGKIVSSVDFEKEIVGAKKMECQDRGGP
ncbi:MAG: hypothetical protein JNN30_17585 [Rhodanobacteraceae bacterium]|nr:hypothetical protein [Rhodanobacteraceae bacterium]